MTKKRHLSIKRVMLAILILAGLFFSAYKGWSRWQDTKPTIKSDPWFAPYVDVVSTPRYPFEQMNGTKNLVLSFIVSSNSSDACMPTWGGAYTLDEASARLDLDRRIARFRQQGGNVAISFGGQLNDELAVRCEDSDNLLNAYKSVIERYEIDTIDLDIEGDDLENSDAMVRRASVISDLQKTQRANGKNLAVWLTLPVAPQGLTESGTNAIAQVLSSGVDLAGVNVMTMDYGASRDKTQTMQKASESALIETHRQLGILYSQAGINLNEASVWAKIGATPMIGQNDVVDEIFSLNDAIGFNEFVRSKHISRLSMWSVNRDIECGENYVNLSVVSDSCSGIKQNKYEFARTLGQGFDGDIAGSSSQVTIESPETERRPDNPDESPYQVWQESGTYLEGTKVVWHHNVYQAKWWTKGDIPDNPVLQSWETPWQLIGPVLAGEKPISQPTLPEGTYPTWSGTEIYDKDQRVLFEGVPYQAKWWTQGDSPAASTSNPDSSPWVRLTRDQVDEIISGL